MGAGKTIEWRAAGSGLSVPRGAWSARAEALLTPQALELVAELNARFEGRRQELLAARRERQKAFDQGALPEYPDRASEAAAGDWRVAPIPRDLLRRRVEITGPVNSAKMVITMLSRGADGARADCAMLDFEDSMKPSWENVLAGIENVKAAAEGTLSYVEPAAGGKAAKHYQLNPDDMAVLMVRARGLHLDESNLQAGGKPVSGGLFDLALSFFHSARALIDGGRTPKYYIPKCEHYLEARWWNDLFCALQECLGFPKGTLRATFLIETLPAAYQIEEILYEIREHAAGLNGGRWDKIFSDIKTLMEHPDRVLADRASIDMLRPWMNNYVLRMIEICHARGAFAMGGMSAFTPGKTAERREEQLAKVMADKRREAEIGHDGCWVSHPFFIGKALEAFTQDNQLERRTTLPDKYPDLLPQSDGPKTLDGLRINVRVGIAYMHGWLRDIGCVAWDDLMEDLATLEISRAQIWQWLRHGVTLDSGERVDRAFVARIFDEESARIAEELEGEDEGLWLRAKEAAQELFLSAEFKPFLSMASDLAG